MLISAACSFSRNIRVNDISAHLGGDEFLIILPSCDVDEAERIMKRIKNDFANFGLEFVNNEWTLSYGYEQWRGVKDREHALLRKADKKMYA